MRQVEDVLAYAERQADELEKDMEWVPNDGRGYWKATDRALLATIAARAAAALEFFRQYAGADSYWMVRAEDLYRNHGAHQSAETGTRALAELLRAWADQVRAEVVEVVGARAWSEIGVVSTDVMVQVRRLLEDRNAHPAAAIVLCGAALEIALRSAVDAHNLTETERPSLGAYTRLLRRKGLLSVQDVKDFEQCAGLRNSAAHGEFDVLSVERAGLMEQQTNILLRKLSDLQT